MKLRHLLIFALACSCAAAEKPADKKEEAKAVEVKRTTTGEVTVTVNDETAKRIDLKTDVLKSAEHTPELTAYGTVLDPSSLLTLHGDIASTQVALDTSKKAAARAKSLFDQGENVARKTLESAEADLHANEIKLRTLQQQLEMEWGARLAKLSSNDLHTLINDLVGDKIVLARVDLPAGERISGEPTKARVASLSAEKWETAEIISRATKVDPKTQGEGYIVRCASTTLRPGAAVRARLQTTSAAEQGFVVPDAAVVQYIGKSWTYVQSAENTFTRQEISLENPVEGGWFRKTSGTLKAGDRVITQGAQELLSEEQKSQISID